MLTVLGKAPAQGDAVDLLLECHERIRSFLLLSHRIAGAAEAEREAVPEAAARVVRYFTQALPLHARDEEESILPRLAGRDPAVDAALATMHREHGEHDAPLGALVAACAELSRDPGRHGALAPEVTAAADALDAHFLAHLRNEEEVIFPALRRLLAADEQAAIVREIRARRGVTEERPGPPA